ncbi:hypothetical protein SHKM778_51510 [Streptomyces sp. KM77-8]|uniref:Extracellular solute-binding protein n=1 Tax=Streptomyces haneummycinicus TaxID=3074435 RepID=A0AAT9HMU9_9ACTN
MEALDYWKALLRDGSLSKSTVNWTQADVNDQFMAGNAAMMINGPWQVETLDSDKSLHWEIAQIPVPEAGADSVGPLGGAVLTVPDTGDTGREKTAGRIVDCLASEQEQLTYALNSWMVPANEKAAAQWRAEVPELDALADQVAAARSRTAKLGAGWSGVSSPCRAPSSPPSPASPAKPPCGAPSSAPRAETEVRAMTTSTVTAPVSAKASKRSAVPDPARQRLRRRLAQWGFVAPAVVFMLLFFGYPLVRNIVMSFQHYTPKTFFTGEAPSTAPTTGRPSSRTASSARRCGTPSSSPPAPCSASSASASPSPSSSTAGSPSAASSDR